MRRFLYLSGEVSSTALGHLEDDGRLGIASSLEGGNDGGRGGDVLELLLAARHSIKLVFDTYNGGNGKLVLASVLEESQDVIANDDTRLAAQNIGSTHFCEVVELIV